MKSRKLLIGLSQVILMMLLATMSFGCLNMPPGDKEPGNYIKEERSVNNFNALDVGGAFKVILAQGDEEKLMLEADADDMPDIVTEVVGRKLRIYTQPGWRGNIHSITVYLTFKQLENMDFSGAVEVSSQEALTFGDLRLDVSGASEIRMDMTLTRLDAEFSGAAEVTFTGSCAKGFIELSGASEIDAQNLEFTDLVLDLSGASDARVFATGELKIDASGASSVRYKGGAKLTVDTSGASSVKQM